MIIGCLVVMSVNGIAARKISKLNIWLNLTNEMQSLITKKLIGILIYIVVQVAMNCGAVLTVASGQEIINTDNKRTDLNQVSSFSYHSIKYLSDLGSGLKFLLCSFNAFKTSSAGISPALYFSIIGSKISSQS